MAAPPPLAIATASHATARLLAHGRRPRRADSRHRLLLPADTCILAADASRFGCRHVAISLLLPASLIDDAVAWPSPLGFLAAARDGKSVAAEASAYSPTILSHLFGHYLNYHAVISAAAPLHMHWSSNTTIQDFGPPLRVNFVGTRALIRACYEILRSRFISRLPPKTLLALFHLHRR